MTDSGQLARIAVELGQARRAALEADMEAVARYLAEAISDIRKARRHLDDGRATGVERFLTIPEPEGELEDEDAPPANPLKARRAARRDRTVTAGPGD